MGHWKAQKVGGMQRPWSPEAWVSVDMKKKPKLLGASREHGQQGTGWEPGISSGMRISDTSQQATGVWGWESEPRALGRGVMPKHSRWLMATLPW